MKSTILKSVCFFSLFILIMSACNINHYKVTLAKTGELNASYTTIDSLNKMNRYFILRNNEMSFFMNKFELSKDQKAVSFMLEYLPGNHLFSSRGGNLYKTYNKFDPDQQEIVNEVHFYINDSSKLQPGFFTLQLEEIQKIEIIQLDEKRTANRHVKRTLAAFLGIGIIVTGIAFGEAFSGY